MQNKKKIIISSLLILLLVVTVAGSSYALWSVSVKSDKTQTLHSGTLELTLGETASSGITLNNAYPMTYEQGMATTAYTFTLKNTGNLDARYEIKVLDGDVSGTRLADKYVRYSLTKNGSETTGLLKRPLETSILKAGATNTYTLHIWIDYDATTDIQGQEFNVKLQISSLVDTSTEGPNAPDLTDGLIPVKWNGTDWVKADSGNGSANPWYDYDAQMWANAVTTTATNRTTYMNAAPGTVIPMSDINTMWVWIPRYEYRYDNLADQYAGGTAAQPGGIDIHFIGKEITGATISNYKVHPAFTFGTDQLAGIWVGKFETGNQTACTATGNVANSACDLTTLGVQVKPNVPSWRGIRVSTAFTVSREMSNAGNQYGLNNSTTDSHMMKNTEWGAVAYLSQSVYGKYANSAYSGANKEVYINNYWNNSQTLTGCSAGAPSTASATSCAYTYEKSTGGTGASTTGNIYGVYDMSGGAYEYVMGNMKANGNTQQQSGYSTSSNQTSGFNGPNYTGEATIGGRDYPAVKYYDTYNYSTSNKDHSTRYIPGDATYEVSQGDGQNRGWYSDYASFVFASGPWFYRSGGYGDAASTGVFNFSTSSGRAFNTLSFRLVLAVTA